MPLRKYKLLTSDCLSLPFQDESFDTVVDTLTLQSVFDLDQEFSELKRVCKVGGKILLMERGQSYIPLYNYWLKFKAARDLCEKGFVENLDFDEIVEKQKGIKIVHRERKNMGMTYIFILEKTNGEEEKGDDDDGTSECP